ncbi:type III secretion protein [Pseudomonas sp. R5-89-07]|uniref:type III secretion protein n=1 Tax=Pseudomonas sp. R5-89-07 TaxID=658644 RepID=UPI0021151AE6|nr:type III secretion protein [Pseudomonas sp. R5-89-07]
MTELLTLLGTLVTSLKTWMNEENALPAPRPPVAVIPKPLVNVIPTPRIDVAPAPETVQPSQGVWKEQLAPFMNRSDLASSRSAFDSELIDMFSDKHRVLSNTFLSEKTKGQKPDDLRNGLRATYENYPYVGTMGREEHVAAIKVAMATFGQSPAGVFKDVVESGDGYNVTMKDGFSLHITREELQLAAKAAKFSGADESMVKDAQFLFGVMSKRQHMELERNNATDPFFKLYGTDSAYHAHRTFPGVLAGAGQGIDGNTALSYLGLKEHIQVVEAGTLGARVGVPLDKGGRTKNGAIFEGAMEGQLYNKPVSPSLKVVTLRD